jgi:hypothetical protein
MPGNSPAIPLADAALGCRGRSDPAGRGTRPQSGTQSDGSGEIDLTSIVAELTIAGSLTGSRPREV